MSNRILLCLFLALSAGTAAGAPGTTRLNQTIALGDGPWLLYRPPPRVVQIHDLDYMMNRLRCNNAGFGLRFSPTRQLRFDLTVAPLTDSDDYIGPVYDMDIGATRLVLSVSF